MAYCGGQSMATRFPYWAEQTPWRWTSGPIFFSLLGVVGTKRIDLEAHSWPQCPGELVLVQEGSTFLPKLSLRHFRWLCFWSTPSAPGRAPSSEFHSSLRYSPNNRGRFDPLCKYLENALFSIFKWINIKYVFPFISFLSTRPDSFWVCIGNEGYYTWVFCHLQNPSKIHFCRLLCFTAVRL